MRLKSEKRRKARAESVLSVFRQSGKVLVLLLSVLIASGSRLVSAAPLQQGSFTVAVVPQFPSPAVKAGWTPLLARISESSGVRLTQKFYKSIPEFEQSFLKGVPDFVYLNPYHAVMARKAQGYIPLVRDADPLVGILVARKDSTIRGVSDLNGKKLVFPSPNAFAASLYMRNLLQEKEKIVFSSRYVRTHSNVYRHVLMDKAAAGGGVNKTLNRERPELRDMLRIIYQTPGVASHPFSAHPRVPSRVREAVADAMMKLAGTDEGREILKIVELARPVPADYRRDYGVLEEMRLDKFFIKGRD